MRASIKGYYVWYFSVAKKELVQTAGSINCSVSCALYGHEVPTETVKNGKDVALSFGVGHCDEVYKDELEWSPASLAVTNWPTRALPVVAFTFYTCILFWYC